MSTPAPNPSPLPGASRLVAGVDGGGSSTRVLLLAEDGAVCGLGLAGPSNPNQVGAEGALEAIAAALRGAWAEAGVTPRPLDAMFIGLAGAHSFGLERLHEGLLRSGSPLAGSGRVEIDHDLRIALAGALGDREGVCVIAGTGSAGYGRTRSGQVARAGGWGPLADDVGSGYWLGVRAIGICIRHLDGRGAASSLADAVLAFFGTRDPAVLRQRLQDPQLGRARIAELAPAVIAGAQEGDALAAALLREGATELVALGRSIGDRLFPRGTVPLALTGGLAENPTYRSVVAEAIHHQAPRLHLQESQHAPVVGAALLAFGLLAGVPETAALERATSRAASPFPIPHEIKKDSREKSGCEHQNRGGGQG